MVANYTGSNVVVGALSSAIFNRGLLDVGSYPFALITASRVRRGIEPDFNNLNTPIHISNVNYDLGNPVNTSTCSDNSCVKNSWKYANFGALDARGDMITQYHFQFPDIRILLSYHEVLMCNAIFHSYSLIMQNRVLSHTYTPHTDSPPAYRRRIWNKFPLFGSILFMLFYPVSACDDNSSGYKSSVLIYSP